MNFQKFLFLFLILLYFTFINVTLYSAPKKYALIVAIGNYPNKNFPTIDSDKDIPLIKTSLLNQGFLENDIILIQDEKATYKNVVDAFNVDLYNKISPGDIVFIHFSSHGTQITDDNGDELDGLDEAIICYDAVPKKIDPEYKGTNYLRDDKLGELIDLLSSKLGSSGNIILNVDACHSGSITRGEELSPVRGVDEGYPPAKTTNRGAEDTKIGGMSQYKPGNAKVVIFSGARHDEKNYETRDDENGWVGALSLTMSHALQNIKGDITYRGLFDMIKKEMSVKSPKQTPQIEGDVDVQVFSGNAVIQKPYYEVKSVDGNKITLIGGSLTGLLVGSIIEFHSANTLDPKGKTPVASGTVTEATELESVVELKTKSGDPAGSWAFIKEQGFGDLTISVKMGDFKNGSLKSSLEDEINKLKMIKQTNDKSELLIKSDKGNDVIVFSTVDDGIIYEKKNSDNNTANDVIDRIKTFARNKYIKSINSTSDEIKLTFEIIPINFDISQFKVTSADNISSKQKGGQYIFNDSDFFQIKIKNEGTLTAYFTILELQSDGIINQMFPNVRLKGADNELKPGAEYKIPAPYRCSPPFGNEVIKLIATKEKINFEPILNSNGQSRGESSNNPLEILMQDAFTGTRSDPVVMPSGSIHTQSFELVIKSKK
jgi:metacaspase-1